MSETHQSRSVEERNLEATRLLYKASMSGDWDAAEEFLSDDLVITEADSLPYAGVYKGRGAMRALFPKVMGVYGEVSLEVSAMTAGGDWVVVLLSINLTNAEKTKIPMAESMRFKDGLVVEVKPYYWDTNEIARIAKSGRNI